MTKELKIVFYKEQTTYVSQDEDHGLKIQNGSIVKFKGSDRLQFIDDIDSIDLETIDEKYGFYLIHLDENIKIHDWAYSKDGYYAHGFYVRPHPMSLNYNKDNYKLFASSSDGVIRNKPSKKLPMLPQKFIEYLVENWPIIDVGQDAHEFPMFKVNCEKNDPNKPIVRDGVISVVGYEKTYTQWEVDDLLNIQKKEITSEMLYKQQDFFEDIPLDALEDVFKASEVLKGWHDNITK